MFAENLEFDHSLVPSERCDQASRNKITKRWGKHVQSPAKAVFFTSSPKDGAVSMDSQARRGTGFVQESELPPDDSQESAETSGIWGKPWVRAQGVLRILPTEWSVQNLANIEWRLLLINRRNSRSLG